MTASHSSASKHRLDVPLLKGEVATVLLHVARRFAYEKGTGLSHLEKVVVADILADCQRGVGF